MNERRPDPDALLRQVQDAERGAARGQLTVFLGYAPGVGKTYSMLLAARAEQAAGRQVLVGVVETHGRQDTEALLADLTVLPRRAIEYRGIRLNEFDVDAALARRPQLILVDELAHTNAEGSRHPKRWQDVEELIEHGIDVFTTVNVQHLDSLNHVVAQVTGVTVRETVPDSVLADANQIQLVDLPPEELLERLAAGKVYVPEQARRAIERFFSQGNLIALRELALRQTAERVDDEMRRYRRAHGIEQTWAVTDRILVGVSPSPYSGRLLHAASRMAHTLRVPWIAVFIETPQNVNLSEPAKARLSQNLRLAEQLGAEVITIPGTQAAESLLRVARERNVTKIVVGKPRRWRWRERFMGSFIGDLLVNSGDIDIYVTTGEEEPTAAPKPLPRRRSAGSPMGYLVSAGIVAAATGVGYVYLGQHEPADTAMLYLLAVVLVSLRTGLGPSLLTAVLSVLAFDFFFIPPFFSFDVSDMRHVLTFGVMILTSVVISGLTGRVRAQAEAARGREKRTGLLYAMSRELAQTADQAAVLDIVSRHVGEVFNSRVRLFPLNEWGLPDMRAAAGGQEDPPIEEGVVLWVAEHLEEAGLGSDTLAGSHGLYLPLRTSGGSVGVIGLFPQSRFQFDDPEQKRLLQGFVSQVAQALERIMLTDQAQRTRLEAERERLRGTLLSSVSHDLRTPLAAITGAASTLLLDQTVALSATQKDLLASIHEEANRLNRLVRNLLDMTRLESGAIEVKREWQPLEEVIGATLRRLEDRLAGREVRVELPPDLPLAPIDGLLIEQVLVNLLENAIKYTPAGSAIEIGAEAGEAMIVVDVADRGPGVAPGEETRIFDKLYRSPRDANKGGVGLGLAICQAIIQAHGGRIWAENRAGGGALFRFTLPIVGQPPQLENEESPTS